MNLPLHAEPSSPVTRPATHVLPGEIRTGPGVGRHDPDGKSGSRRRVAWIAVVAGLVLVVGAFVLLRNRDPWPDDPEAYIPDSVDGQTVGRDTDQIAAMRDALLDQAGQTGEEDDLAAGAVGNTAGFPDLVLLAVRVQNQEAWLSRLEESQGGTARHEDVDGVPVLVFEEGEESFGVGVVTAVAKPGDDMLAICVAIGAGDPLEDLPDTEVSGSAPDDAGTARAVDCAVAMLEAAR